MSRRSDISQHARKSLNEQAQLVATPKHQDRYMARACYNLFLTGVHWCLTVTPCSQQLQTALRLHKHCKTAQVEQHCVTLGVAEQLRNPKQTLNQSQDELSLGMGPVSPVRGMSQVSHEGSHSSIVSGV